MDGTFGIESAKRRGRWAGIRTALVIGLLGSSSLNTASAAPSPVPSVNSAVETLPSPESCARVPASFTGTVGQTLPTSKEAWPQLPQAPKGAPNVLIWLIDDAGFGLTTTYGGLVETPNMDKLAAQGLLYTNYHSTPLCSPSRASLLTGRNPHSVHMGAHAGTAMGYPGYDGYIPATAATTAKVLQEHGYGTVALGKWDHTPFKFQTPVGPFNLWPLGQGFDHFYGFMWHESDQFHPTLVRDNTVIETPVSRSDYILSADMADRAISYINSLHSISPDKPFYLYWATGAVHSPLQASLKWRQHYRGRFDMGWDEYRKEVMARQKARGIIPQNTELAPLQPELPSWRTLSPDQKKLYARQMEAIAAEMSEADNEFGRIVDTLKHNGEFDNTIIIVTSDNGASAEGGPEGSFSESARSFGLKITDAENMAHYDDFGGPKIDPQYSAGWAVAANTPFRYFKQTAHDGGNHVPMIVSWPDGISQPGMRSQYTYIADIGPTLLDAIGIAPPSCVDGVPQQKLDGISFNYTFNNALAPERRKTQYYELWGNRGIYNDGWKAVVLHKRAAWDIQGGVPFSDDKWELYNVRNDPGEAHDLSAAQPQKLAEMERIFDAEARGYNVYPLADIGARTVARSGQQFQAQTARTVYDYPQPGVTAMTELAAAPTAGRSYTLTATFDAKANDEGVIVAAGGNETGYSLYVKGGRVHYDYNEFGLMGMSLSDENPLPAGRSNIELRWVQETRAGGTMTLVVNGREVGHQHVDIHVFGMHGNNELFNIGLDTGAPASSAYEAPFAFTGTIDDVKVTLGPRPGEAN